MRWSRRGMVVVAALAGSIGCVAPQGGQLAPRGPAADPEAAQEPEVIAPPDGAKPSPPAPPLGLLPPGAYDLAQLPVFSKVLFYARENYFDKRRFDYKRMLLGALDFVQRDVPEVVVERRPASDPRQVTLEVSGYTRSFSLDRIDAPWNLRSKLQDIFRFVQPCLPPIDDRDAPRRLLEIERAAVNGMLYTLDPHSVLLDAQAYGDMRTPSGATALGGIGLVIEMDASDHVTIKRAMAGSPAARAGIKPGDRLVRIDDTPTGSLTLAETAQRLRGAMDSSVDVYVERAGTAGVKKLTARRAFIRYPAVDPPAQLLPAGKDTAEAKIGYLRLRAFAHSAATEVADGLEMFQREGVKGIVLDLRDNHGGLYEQAHKVTDAFVESGTLVAMVGPGGNPRKDEVATQTGRKPKVPMVVLVNRASASASEIVAGSLQHLDRALVIGESTSGMGSVQVMFDIRSPTDRRSGGQRELLGLKLTTAQFLAAGSVSIQAVGITPDIHLQGLRVPERSAASAIRLQPSQHGRREQDYEHHLQSSAPRAADKAAEQVAYVQAEGEAEPGEDAAELAIESDFALTLARDLLTRAKAGGRRDLLGQARPLLTGVRVAQDQRVVAALGRRSVDWSAGPTASAPPRLQLTLQQAPGPAAIAAGGVVTLRGVVKNVGSTPAFRVRAVLESDHAIFDERELLFGRIGPGESKTYDLAIDVPASTLTRTDLVRAALTSQGALPEAGAAETTVDLTGAPRPDLAYRYRIDGRLQRGRPARLEVTVQNRGPGPCQRLRAVLRNRDERSDVVIGAGRFDVDALAAGASKTFAFQLTVPPNSAASRAELELGLADARLNEALTGPVAIDIAGTNGGAVEVTPPVLTASAPAVTTGDTVRVTGQATDDRLVRDVFMLVWNRNAKVLVTKAFYRSNPSATDRARMDFQADVPVLPGSNLIEVFARESNDVQTKRTLVVLRRPAPAKR